MKTLKKIGVLPLILMLMMIAVACNNGQGNRMDATEIAENVNDTTAQVNESDAQFAVRAADHNMGSIQLANLAMENANDSRIKAIAISLLEEHQMANQELSGISRRKMITLPEAPGDNQLDDIKKLHEEQANEFDKTYLELMINKHEDLRDLLENASEDARDTDLQAYASKYLPLIKKHEEHLKSLSDSMGYVFDPQTSRTIIP